MDTLIGSVCWEDSHACKYVFCNPSVEAHTQHAVYVHQSVFCSKRFVSLYAKSSWFVVACLGHDWHGFSSVGTDENLQWCSGFDSTSPTKWANFAWEQRNEWEECLTLMTFTNLDGTGGYLDLVQFPHCAIAIDEVGWSQLMKGFHILSSIGKLPVQLVFGQVHRQRLLS